MNLPTILDPVGLIQNLWPTVQLYDKQKQMVYAVRDSVETYVVAGNKLGKDFISGAIALTFFLCPWVYYPVAYARTVEARRGKSFTYGDNVQEQVKVPAQADPHTRRVITTSVKDEHLDVLWAEIARWVTTCRINLLEVDYGIVMVHHEIRLKAESEAKNPLNYLKGQVSAKGEGLAGHHAAYTLGIGDEASGLADECYKQFQGWAKRMLMFGNPNPCNNFFRRNYEMGDLLAV